MLLADLNSAQKVLSKPETVVTFGPPGHPSSTGLLVYYKDLESLWALELAVIQCRARNRVGAVRWEPRSAVQKILAYLMYDDHSTRQALPPITVL